MLSISAGVCAVSLMVLGAASETTTFDVRAFGAKADGQTDDTAAFNAAVRAAESAAGGTVLAPRGSYRVAGHIEVRPGVTLRGEYCGIGRQHGTILLVTGGRGQTDGPACLTLVGGNNALIGIAMAYPEQTADATEPVPYPYAIHGGPASRIEDVFLLNPYLGINLDAAHANLVRNVWGEPLRVGLHADHIYDISRIENIHFWPFFTLNKPLRQWVQQHGVAFEFGRSDWQSCTNTFSYGYHTGYRFYATGPVPERNYPAGTTNGSFVGIGADSCVIGVDVEDSFTIGTTITNGMFAPFASDYGRGVLLRAGNTGNLTLIGCNFWAVTGTVAEVHSGSLALESCNIHDWAVTRKEAPCLLVDGGRLRVSGCTFNKGGLLAVLEGTSTRALFSGNMGNDDPLTVHNGIGDRAVFSSNLPALEVVTSPRP